MGKLKEQLDRIEANLSEHMRRTAIAEIRIETHHDLLDKLSNRVHPLEKHVAAWAGAGKALAIGLSTAVAVGTLIWRLLQ